VVQGLHSGFPKNVAYASFPSVKADTLLNYEWVQRIRFGETKDRTVCTGNSLLFDKGEVASELFA
jgi:hypothetical protein